MKMINFTLRFIPLFGAHAPLWFLLLQPTIRYITNFFNHDLVMLVGKHLFFLKFVLFRHICCVFVTCMKLLCLLYYKLYYKVIIRNDV